MRSLFASEVYSFTEPGVVLNRPITTELAFDPSVVPQGNISFPGLGNSLWPTHLWRYWPSHIKRADNIDNNKTYDRVNRIRRSPRIHKRRKRDGLDGKTL